MVKQHRRQRRVALARWRGVQHLNARQPFCIQFNHARPAVDVDSAEFTCPDLNLRTTSQILYKI